VTLKEKTNQSKREVEKEVDNTLEQTIKRIERLNRILTVAVVVEAIALVIFL
jgi:hypothetical protein